MKNEQVFCPLIKNSCKKKQCALWIMTFEHCAINWLAQCLDDQVNTLEEVVKNSGDEQ